MKYVSIFATIVLIWVAVILMALTRNNATDVFDLYLATIVCTGVLFFIGFARK